MSAVTVAENVALLATQLSAIRGAATGMDEVVSRETLIRAGERGPERVTITPANTDMEARQRGEGLVFNPVVNVYGPLDQNAARTVIEEEERLARQLAGMIEDGF
jgi:hypothetical protein